MRQAEVEPLETREGGVHVHEVRESDIARFRRSALTNGGVILQSCPVPGGYLVTVRYERRA